MDFLILAALLSLQNDSDLIQRLKRREAEAMGELYDRFGKVAFAVIVRIVRNASVAEDLVQETFLKVWNRIEGFDEVRRSDNEYKFILVEPVHLGQHLIERLLAFVVTAAGNRTGRSSAPDGVELVDEDDRRRFALGLHAPSRGIPFDDGNERLLVGEQRVRARPLWPNRLGRRQPIHLALFRLMRSRHDLWRCPR